MPAGRTAAPSLARVLTTVAARAALPIAIPLYAGLGVVSAVLFAPKAMHAAEVTRAAISSPWLGTGLFAAWVVTTAPIARAVLEMPSTYLFRALPVARWRFWGLSGAHLAIVELPWIILWTRGEGVVSGAAACMAAVAAHALLVARPLRPLELALAALLAAAFVAGAPAPLLLAVGAVAAPVALSAAWRRAPERDARPRHAPLAGPAALALAVSHLVGLRRAEPTVVVRAVIPVVIGGVITPMAARGYDLDLVAAESALSLVVATLSLAIAVAGIASAIARAERRDRWLLDATGVGGAARVAGASGATAFAGAALGAVHGALAARGLDAGVPLALRLVGLAAAWGAILGVAAAAYGRRAQRGGRKDADRALLGFAFAVAVAVGSISAFGEIVLLPALLAATLVAAISARSATALPEPFCVRASPRRQPA